MGGNVFALIVVELSAGNINQDRLKANTASLMNRAYSAVYIYLDDTWGDCPRLAS